MASTVAPEPSSGGLSEEQAQARLRDEGFNDLPSSDRRTLLTIVADLMLERPSPHRSAPADATTLCPA